MHGTTHGLDFFGHPELLVDVASPADAARLLYNAGTSVTNGASFASGDTMSSGPLHAHVEAAGEALALRLR